LLHLLCAPALARSSHRFGRGTTRRARRPEFAGAVLNIRDFLIDPAGKDWNKLLGYWSPVLPPQVTLWLVNRLGDALLASRNGAILWLVVGTGSVMEIARDRETFARLLDRRENADEWLRIPLVEGCRQAGMQLGADECYGFKVPPALLGKYAVSNLQPTNIYSHYSWLSHMCRQDEIYWTGD
jgi:hypothetical protein